MQPSIPVENSNFREEAIANLKSKPFPKKYLLCNFILYPKFVCRSKGGLITFIGTVLKSTRYEVDGNFDEIFQFLNKLPCI